MKNINAHICFAFFALVTVLFGAYAWFNFDHAFVGVDGEIYLSWAKDFPNSVNKVLNPYFLQKSLPSILVNILLRVMRLSPTRDNIILASLILNCLANIGSIFILFYLFFKNLNLKTRFYITYLFVISMASLSVFFKSPVLNDTLAIFFAFGLFYSFKRGWLLPMAGCIVLGAFCYPIFLQLGLPLLLFPLGLTISKSEKMQKYSTILASLVAAVAAVFVAYIFYSGVYVDLIYPAKMDAFEPLLTNFVPVSIAAIAVFYFIFSRFIFSYNFTSKHLFSHVFSTKIILRAIIAVACFAAITFVVSKFALHEKSPIHFLRLIVFPFVLALNFPASFYYNAIMWFGLTYVMFVVYIYRNKTNTIPFAYFLLMIIFFQLAVVNESRALVVFIPMMLDMLVGELTSFSNKKWQYLLTIQAAIVTLVFFVYNGQTAFFKYGPWMEMNNNILFFVSGIAVTATYLLIDKYITYDSNSKALPNS